VRVAILADIHGNLVALKAALADLRRRKVEKVICLGDVAATGPQPREVIELLQPLNWPCVMGNADETLARSTPDIPHEKAWLQMPEEDKRRMLELEEWTRKQLRRSHRSYLASFKPTVVFIPKNGPKFLFYHGSPRSNREEIFATTANDELARYLEGYEAEIFAGGHTHMQMLRRFQKSTIMNPGSVGLPIDVHPPWAGVVRNPTRAEYAIVNFAGKSFNLEFLSVPYSRADLETAVRYSGLPNADWWLADWC
jgi:predicted phosphodiesterase